jgi:hypothetical protein
MRQFDPIFSLLPILLEDSGLIADLAGLFDGSKMWEEIPDELGIDVETGNPIPEGKTEA